MRTCKTRYIGFATWLTTFNLWICDSEHQDTCFFFINLTKPTQRQIRKMRKAASKHYRRGTRAEQRANRHD